MEKIKKSEVASDGDMGQRDAYPDASGFIQNHPDARGFAPGKQPEKADGKWHSDHPDAHGWRHSSSG